MNTRFSFTSTLSHSLSSLLLASAVLFAALAPEPCTAQFNIFQVVSGDGIAPFRGVRFNEDGSNVYLQANEIRRYSTSSSNELLSTSRTFFMGSCPQEPVPEIYQGIVDLLPGNDSLPTLVAFEGGACISHNSTEGRARIYDEKYDTHTLLTMDACSTFSVRPFAFARSKKDRSHVFCAFDAFRYFYKSSDGGATFRPWATAPYNRHSTSTGECAEQYFSGILACDPSDTATVYASGYAHSGENILYRTTDNGATWDSVFSFPPQRFISDHIREERLYFYPKNPKIIYLRLDSAVYYSRNSGDTWTALLENRAVYSLAASRDELVAGCDSGVVMVTGPDGGSWHTILTLPTASPVIGLFSSGMWMSGIAATTDAVYLYSLPGDIPPETDQSAFEVFPNPSGGETTIRLPEDIAPCSLSIVDMFGRTVRSFGTRQAGTSLVWDGTDNTGARVATGLYTCVFGNGSGVVRIPVLLQR